MFVTRITAISDCDNLASVVRVQGVCVVRECVHSGKRWMQIAVTTDDLLSVHTDYASYAKLLSCDREPRKKKKRVTA